MHALALAGTEGMGALATSPTEWTHGPAALTPYCLYFSQVAVASRAQGDRAAESRRGLFHVGQSASNRAGRGWDLGTCGGSSYSREDGWAGRHGKTTGVTTLEAQSRTRGRCEPRRTDVSTAVSTSSFTY